MATIPTNPSDGDTFTDGVGVTWTYKSSSNKWLIPVATSGSGGGGGGSDIASYISATKNGTLTTVNEAITTTTGIGPFTTAKWLNMTGSSGNYVYWDSQAGRGYTYNASFKITNGGGYRLLVASPVSGNSAATAISYDIVIEPDGFTHALSSSQGRSMIFMPVDSVVVLSTAAASSTNATIQGEIWDA